MDELSATPLNQAHIRARKAAVALEKGDRLAAINLYRQVNELLRSARDIGGNDENIKRSIQLQIDDNDWKIRSLQLKDLAEFKKALGGYEEADEVSESRLARFAVEDEEEDDGVVLISSSDHLDFFMDSICPSATIIRQNSNNKDRLSDIPFNKGKISSSHQLLGDRLHRSPSLPESNSFPFGRRLPKSEAQKEAEKSTLRMHHEIWSRQNLI